MAIEDLHHYRSGEVPKVGDLVKFLGIEESKIIDPKEGRGSLAIITRVDLGMIRFHWLDDVRIRLKYKALWAFRFELVSRNPSLLNWI